jgi:hypothetical protein
VNVRKYILIAILISSFYAHAPNSRAAYDASELFAIPWGDSTTQLKIAIPTYEDENETPIDTTDDFISTGGPDEGFVDHNENIYFSSYYFLQLKAFHKDGGLICDYSKGSNDYDPEFYRGWLRKIYVDSLSRIYILGGADQNYITVVDAMRHILEKLTPFGENSGIAAEGIYFNSADVLTLYFKNHQYYTYSKSTYDTGGAAGWKAIDGNYYNAGLEDSLSIRLIKYKEPNISGIPTHLDEIITSTSDFTAYFIDFLGVDDKMNIYVFLSGDDPADSRILIYDNSFNLIDKMVLPKIDNKYQWYMAPFMRPSDGNIYEFRCQDNGLHVIRWIKQ